MLKQCSNCKHMRMPGSFARCAAGAVAVEEDLTGFKKPTELLTYCSTERMTPVSTSCGPTGKFWEAAKGVAYDPS
jgi:hypothetical protein